MTRKLEDSGQRREFSTGAVRDRGDLKPRPDLISPHAQMREGMIHTLGSQKYALRNWEQGIPISECLASAQRHIEQYKRGDTNEDHIAQARWNLGAIIHFEEEIKAGRLDPSLDDLPKYANPPICPRCGAAMTPQFVAETSDVEYFCGNCGLTSLDAWPSADTETHLVEELKERGEEYLAQEGPYWEIPFRATEVEPLRGPNPYSLPLRESEVDPFPIDPPVLVESPDAQPSAFDCAQSEQEMFFDALERAAYAAPTEEALWGPQSRPRDMKPLPTTTEPPTFYIAGPMRGYKELNFSAFDKAAERGRKIGYNIISPADLDREHGIDPEKNPEVAEQEDHLSTSDLHRIIRRDLEAIMALQPTRGDGIAVLTGWRDSTGASTEVALARWLGLKVVYVTDFYTLVEDE